MTSLTFLSNGCLFFREIQSLTRLASSLEWNYDIINTDVKEARRKLYGIIS